MAKELNISRILAKKLKVKPFKKFTNQELTAAHQKKQLNGSKALIRLLDDGEFPNSEFSDEKTFCIEPYFKKQNDRVWLQGRASNHSGELRVTRRQEAAQIMVWAAVTENGRSPLLFQPTGKDAVKINQRI